MLGGFVFVNNKTYILSVRYIYLTYDPLVKKETYQTCDPFKKIFFFLHCTSIAPNKLS